jgi:ABC-type antimicrobial peptide transport system permease subunit
MSLILQSFRYYAKSHLGLLGGAFLTSAILSGSLLVGDSVRQSLRHAAEQRLGKIQSGILGNDRWFTEDLARKAGAAPVILMSGSVSESTGKARVNAVQVCGVDEAFWKLAPNGGQNSGTAGTDEVAVNSSLARRLGVKAGDTVLIRLEAPSAISRDAPLSGDTNQEVTMRRKVSRIVNAEGFGSFQLTASQLGSDTVFVTLKDLQEAVEKKDRVNGMLSATALPQPFEGTVTMEDFALKLEGTQGTADKWQITTDRVFLDEAIAGKLLKARPGAYGVLTYMVNGLSSPKSPARTPYSMVTSTTDPPSRTGEAAKSPAAGGSEKLATITQWLADDLSLAPGDTFDIRFFKVGIGRELKEETATFTVRDILPMTDPRVNKSWTPNFPGVSDVDNCRDWKPGMPVKLDAIRDKDEKYWDDYRGTPKAFIGLEVGQKLWGNRFGKLTAIRFGGDDTEASLKKELASALKLSDIGLVPRDFRGEASAAAKGSVDFGGLFIGLSLFLIAAALVFSALLFLFTLEKRASQVGLLLAVGWTPARVRKTVLGEAGLVALVGSALGLLGGLAYTKLALAGLNGIWADATAGMRLLFHAEPLTLIIAFVASLLAAMGTLWWASRKMFRAKAKDLLVGEAWSAGGAQPAITKGRLKSALRVIMPWLPLICLVSAIGMSFAGSKASNPEEIAGMFFGAGFLLLIAGLLVIRRQLRSQDDRVSSIAHPASSISAIGLRNVTRRPGRSLAVIGMMAGGIFLVIAVNAFRLSADADPTDRHSGTGGFALIGESTLPIYEDLNASAGWDAFGLDETVMKAVKVVPFRVREGDDASCLNLNRAQNPVLCGVNPKQLTERDAFAFVEGSWDKLSSAPTEIPAIADQATAMWGLGKGVGDTLSYMGTDGKPFTVKLVGLLAGSVLQGKVIISEEAFLSKFPDAAGYKFYLMDVPQDAVANVSAHLTKQIQSRGLALEPATSRLAAFMAVQNTYIGIFTVLGGLGVLLGTAGLGVLAARNILERKGEFGLMQALGFLPAALRKMVLSEHVALLAAGLVLGLVSAAVAVWPNVRQSGGALPVGFLIWLNLGILAFGVAVCWLAARVALTGKLLEAVRRE